MTSSDELGTAARCERCGERFAGVGLLALHRGRVHGEELTDAELAAFEEARADEEAWLAGFRAHLVGALSGGSVIFVYLAVVLSSYVLRANPALVVLPAPGIVGFAVVTYWLAYRHRREFEARGDEAPS